MNDLYFTKGIVTYNMSKPHYSEEIIQTCLNQAQGTDHFNNILFETCLNCDEETFKNLQNIVQKEKRKALEFCTLYGLTPPVQIFNVYEYFLERALSVLESLQSDYDYLMEKVQELDSTLDYDYEDIRREHSIDNIFKDVKMNDATGDYGREIERLSKTLECLFPYEDKK